MDLKKKKIAVLGLGDENFVLAKYLLSHGAKVTICDKKSKEELGGFYTDLSSSGVDFLLGSNYLSRLADFDMVFRTPGLPFFNTDIQAAITGGVEVTSQINLFFNLCPCPIIGITGTKGKGTTTSLIGNILKTSGRDVYVGGNIGNAPIGFLDKLTADSIVVLELSSFQLQDIKYSPHIAVVLDIKIDHLDYHKDEKEYISAKRNIVSLQKQTDFAVINADYLTSIDFATSTKAKIYWFSRRKSVDEGVFLIKNELTLRINDEDIPIIKTEDIKLRGEHNLENISAAIMASYLAGAKPEDIKRAVTSFKGLEHRLELVTEKNGVKYYNDSFSTTPDTTIAAIKSFNEPIILLLGGSEKNADYHQLAKAIDESTVKLIINIGKTGERIISLLENNGTYEIIAEIKTMQEALRLAKEKSSPGDIVLLSPASASFDQFKNYKDRGRQFSREASI